MTLRRDRAAVILSFVVPIVFFSIFAGIFGAQRSQTPRTKVAVVDEDRSPESQRLLSALRAESALNVITQPKGASTAFDARSAEAYVRAGSASVALIIPQGFGRTPLQFGPGTGPPSFRLLTDSSDPIAQQVVAGLLQKVVFTGLPDSMMKAGVAALDRFGANLTDDQRASLERSIDSVRSSPARTAPSSSSSPIRIEARDLLGEKKKNPAVALYAAGIGVMFLLFTASNAGGTLLEENESGTLDRILTTRVTMTTLLLGKLLYLWVLGMTQLIVMFVWGAVVFYLELISHIGRFLLVASATSLATAAFGLLIASVARTRQQLAAISTLAVLSISALGGSMFPRFLMPESIQKMGLILFNSWALDALTDIFWREAPVARLLLPMAVLLAWAALFFAVARALARRWEAS